MVKNEGKQMLPFAGILIVSAALLAVQGGRVDTLTLLMHEIIVIFGYIAAILDMKAKKIPNSLVMSMIAVWIIVMVPALFLAIDAAIIALKDSVLGFALGGGLFLVVYFVSRRGLGGGDVKFMAGAGLYLGMGGVIPTIFCGTLIAALTGLALILLKKIGRKDKIPLVPFLYVGILITVFLA